MTNNVNPVIPAKRYFSLDEMCELVQISPSQFAQWQHENGIVVGYGGGVVTQQNVFRIRRLLGHLDAQAGNHADDVVDLFGIGHIVGQGVVDFGISDVAAFLTHDDELAQAGALLFEGQRTVVVLFLIVFVILVFRHGLLS